MWQTFLIENYGGRVIYNMDAVFLKSHTGTFVDVQGMAVQSRWSSRGNWQKMFIVKKDGSGAVMPGDTIFLRTHTGKMIDVEGDAVQARYSDYGAWQALILEKKSEPEPEPEPAPRHLTETTADEAAFEATSSMVLV